MYKAIAVGEAWLGGKVVHLIVEQHAGPGTTMRAKAEVDGVGVCNNVAKLINDREMGRLRALIVVNTSGLMTSEGVATSS